MEDFEFDPPSFSLGFDLDIGSDSQKDSSVQPVKLPSILTSTRSRVIVVEDDDGFESSGGVSGKVISDPPLVLRRLRKGSAAQPKFNEQTTESKDSCRRYNVDDEIEGFSSEEDRPRAGNLPSHSVCSSSKSSLHCQSVLTSQRGNFSKPTERKGVSSVLLSGKAETRNINLNCPKLAVSPLRRFQLIDSDSDPDSDDPYVSEDAYKEVSRSNLSSKEIRSKTSEFAASSIPGTSKSQIHNHQTDLWNDFCPDKSLHIPTPAFDEVCDEFFKSRNSKNESEIDLMGSSIENKLDMSSLPPSHRYFFHEDSRIQKLVRDRLPNFFPLGAEKCPGLKQQNAAVIDYMGQFNHEGSSKQTSKRQCVETSSRKVKKNGKESNVSMSQDSEDWVNPKSSGIPKDAGKRRVSAAGKSAGYWYTGSNGQRVYVSRNGQKSTGNTAYRDYRKESGMGFKKSKKKAWAKKKTTSKKGTAQKKT